MTNQPHHPSRVRWLSAMLLAVVFFAGSLTGAAALNGRLGSAAAQRISIDATQGLGALGLSAEQRAGVDRIMARHQPAVDSIVQTAMDDLRTRMESVHAEVRELLSPDQVLLLDSLLLEGPRVRAVRRTLGPDGSVLQTDTIR